MLYLKYASFCQQKNHKNENKTIILLQKYLRPKKLYFIDQLE
jgi:hypothetical protein